MLHKAMATIVRGRLLLGRHLPRWSVHAPAKRHLSGDKTVSITKLNNLSPHKVMFKQTASIYDSTNQVHQTIQNLIKNSKKRVFVFMKGVPSEPLCRYSGVVVQILEAYGVEFDSCDVLANEQIRQEIKSYSDWPTIPQVYMDGSFIGGCDILLQMHQSGELKQLFGPKEDDGSNK